MLVPLCWATCSIAAAIPSPAGCTGSSGNQNLKCHVPCQILGGGHSMLHAGTMSQLRPARFTRWSSCVLLPLAFFAFAQTPAPATPETDYYTLHPGDTIDVIFRFTPEFNDEVTIGPDGRASLKSTGDITLAGLTLPEVQREIVMQSSAKLVDPEVAVSLKDFERPAVVVAGEVQTPGKFELRKPTTALQAILLAGGPKEDSAMNHVYLFRRINTDTAEVHVLQLGRYDGRERAKNDLLLKPGDMILVNRDALEKIGRFIKTFNLGVYFNPIGNNGIF